MRDVAQQIMRVTIPCQTVAPLLPTRVIKNYKVPWHRPLASISLIIIVVPLAEAQSQFGK